MKKIIIFLGFAAAIGLAFASCGKSSSTAGGAVSIVNGSAGAYQGAGSRWEATFTTTAFEIKKFADAVTSTASLTVSGNYIEFSSGFRKLTVTAASGAGAPALGSQAYGFDVPGFAFFLKPIGSDSEPIVMLSKGSCPSSGFNGNWIIAKFENGKVLNDTVDNFGTASFNMSTPASSVATINKLSALTATSLGSNVVNFNYTTCANSVLTFNIPATTPTEVVDMFFTSNGGALVHSYNGTTHDSIIFAAPKHTADVTQADLAGTYSVLVFDHSASSNKLFPAKLVIPTTGNATATRIADVETDTATSDPAIPIGNFTAKAGTSGLFTASIDPLAQNGRISCAYFTMSSKKVIACNGYGSAAGGHEPFFFLARER